MAQPTNAVRFNATGYGTADFIVASAATNYQTPEQANVTDGKTYRYYAQSLDGTQWEAGSGPYTVATHKLSRTTIQGTSSGDTNVVNFAAAPIVDVFSSPATSLEPVTAPSVLYTAQTLTAAQQTQAQLNVGVNQSTQITSAVDLNTITAAGTYYCNNNNNTNGPTVGGQWYIEVLVYGSAPTQYRAQRATNLVGTDSTTYTRNLIAAVWSPWQALVNSGVQSLTSAQQLQARKNIAAVLRGQIAGLTLSTAGSSATFAVAAGEAADSTASDLMVLAASISKTTAAWVVGTGNGSLDTGTIAANTWYHAYLIKRLDTGVVDVLTSLSATAPTMPTNYTPARRVGSMKTDGAAQWIKFIQDGNIFTWDVPTADIQVTNPGTVAVTRTLTTPLGLRVQAQITVTGNGSVAQSDNPGAVIVSDLSITDNAPIAGNGITSFTAYSATAAVQVGGIAYVFTNTSSQVRSRLQLSSTNTILSIATLGWIDTRGRDS